MEDQELKPITQDFTIQRWTREAGLPQNSVKVIRIGPDGLLWGASGTVLWRFDGVRFASAIPMPESDTDTYSSNIMKLDFLDRNHLFVGRIGQPPLIYENGWRALSEWQGKPLRKPYDYAVRSNRIAFITEAAIAWSEGSTWQYSTVPNDATTGFKKGCFASDGSLWVTAARGLYHLTHDQCTRVPVPVFEDDFAYEAICMGTSNQVWVFRNPSDFSCLESNQWTKLPPVQKRKISRMGIVTMVERNGRELWAGGQNGLYRWDGNAWNEVYTGEGLYPPGINDLIVDSDGAVWAATEGGGLLCFRERKINILRLPTGREQQVFTALYQSSDGFLYAGVAGRGLWRKQQGSPFAQVPLPDLASQATVMSLAEDPTQALLVGALGHHLLRTDSAFQTQPIYPGPKVPFMDSGIRALLKVNDKIWVGTQRGVMIYSPGAGLVWPAHQPSHTINALAVSTDGSTVYAASETEGVLAFSTAPKHAWTRLSKGLPETNVEALLVAHDGKLWAGGTFGLLYYTHELWNAYTDPLLADKMRVVQILEDDSQRLWLGTTKGILRIDPREPSNPRAHTPSMPSILLGIEDGLDDASCTGGFSPAGLKLTDGTLFFPTQNGLACLDPTQLFLNPDPGIPIVDEIDCDGHLWWNRSVMPIPSIHSAPAIRLPTGAQQITIRWLNTHTRHNSAARFRVNLKGPLTQETILTQKREVSFEHLPPGHYAFTIAHVDQTPLPKEESTARFIIPPLWWQREIVQFGFVILLLSCVGGLGWWMARIRGKRLRKTDQLRLRIARDLHDEIGANLGGIALLLDMASTGSGDQEAFEKIGSIIRQSITTLKDLVWMIDPIHDNASDLVSRMRDTSDMLLASLPHTFDATDVPHNERPIATTVRRNILPVFKEALHNILRHARAKHVHITLTIHLSTLVLIIEDDGIGIPEIAPVQGHGLRNMRRRAQEMNAQLDFETPSHGGTRLTLTIPMIKD
jgi:hypothetical protein